MPFWVPIGILDLHLEAQQPLSVRHVVSQSFIHSSCLDTEITSSTDYQVSSPLPRSGSGLEANFLQYRPSRFSLVGSEKVFSNVPRAVFAFRKPGSFIIETSLRIWTDLSLFTLARIMRFILCLSNRDLRDSRRRVPKGEFLQCIGSILGAGFPRQHISGHFI